MRHDDIGADGSSVSHETALRLLNKAVRDCAQELIRTADDAARTELTHLLAHTETPRFVPGRTARQGAASRFLPAILAAPFAGPTAQIAAALRGVWQQLDWHYHYPDRDDAPGLHERVAFAELVGPDAPLAATDIRLGFTLLGPDILYPSHAHPAHELYVVLSGRAAWTQSGHTAWRDPGAMIVHASEESHAMRTDAAPLLALYSWRGAIDAPARYV